MKGHIFAKCRIFSTAVFASALLGGGLSSCTTFDDSELKNSIDNLENRVEALEDFCDQVQSDIVSLQEIIEKLQSSVTVDNIVEGDNGYTINFSDGTSVTIINGEDGMTLPSITVKEEDGVWYWAYENPDGSTDFITDDDGNKLPVSGNAPQVRINPDNGNWEISNDGGKTWEDTGMPSSGNGESLFTDVSEDENNIYLTLRDGSVITIPKTGLLNFSFGTGTETLMFSNGESKILDYTMSGASTVTIAKPDGWRASIETEGFVITAPVAENTFAETEGTISVILTSSNGQSFVAEQKVAIGVSFASGDGSIENPYIIATPEQLMLMSENINTGDQTYTNAHYALGADIDMEGFEYTPAKCSYTAPFKGSFDGKGFKIENLYINLPDNEYVALFGITDNAAFRNITIASGEITGGRYTSSIAARVNGSSAIMENCVNYASVTGTKNATAGLAAQLYGMATMKNCENHGNISGLNEVGGLVTYATASTIEGCSNYGHVTATSGGVGGIFYNGTGTGNATGCTNYGIVESRTSAGGIVSGLGSGYTVKNSTNEGEVIVSQNGAGGIAGGLSSSGSVEGCENKGKITGKSDGGTAVTSAGGIVGTAGENSAITDCINSQGATFTGFSNSIGGIVGTARKSTINNCENYAPMLLTDEYDVGGIVGNNNANLNFCINHAEINGHTNVGGIVGYNGDLSKVRMCENLGEISGSQFIGGISGVTYSTVSASANRATINGGQYAGGVSGAVSGPYSYLVANYNTGEIHGTSYVGGITGVISNNGLVTACYSVSGIVAESTFGGACGSIDDEASQMISCFYAGFNGPALGNGSAECLYFSDGTEVPSGATAGWPSDSVEQWGINTPGNDGQNGLWWKDLGTEGSQDYPELWWE